MLESRPGQQGAQQRTQQRTQQLMQCPENVAAHHLHLFRVHTARCTVTVRFKKILLPEPYDLTLTLSLAPNTTSPHSLGLRIRPQMLTPSHLPKKTTAPPRAPAPRTGTRVLPRRLRSYREARNTSPTFNYS